MRKKRTHKNEIKQNTTAFMDSVNVHIAWLFDIQVVSKNLLSSGELYIVVPPFGFLFSGCLTRRVISAAKIVFIQIYN